MDSIGGALVRYCWREGLPKSDEKADWWHKFYLDEQLGSRLRDAWSRPIELRAMTRSPGKFVLISMGSDAQFGTDDDISKTYNARQLKRSYAP